MGDAKKPRIEAIDGLVSVKADGNWYLCELHETLGKVVLKRAVAWKGEALSTVRLWIQQWNLKELQTFSLGDTNYVTQPLNAEQKRILRREWEDMMEVKKTAIARLENSYFMK